MVYKYKKTEHAIRTKDGQYISLYLVTNYDFGSNYSIVKIESATGDGGVTYNNGRLLQSIPISGEILGGNITDINIKSLIIQRVSDRKEVIEFVYPFKGHFVSNEFYIESVRFTPVAGNDTVINFSLVLVENRTANVKTTQVNLVNFAPAELYNEIYRQRTEGTE